MANSLKAISEGGSDVCLAFGTGDVQRGLRPLTRIRLLRKEPPVGVRSKARYHLKTRTPPWDTGLPGVAVRDHRLRSALDNADVIVPIGDLGRQTVARLESHGWKVPVMGLEEFRQVGAVLRLQAAASEDGDPSSPRLPLPGVAKLVRALDGPLPQGTVPFLVRWVLELLLSGKHVEATEFSERISSSPADGLSDSDAARRAAAVAMATLTLEAEMPADLTVAVDMVLGEADSAIASGDPGTCAEFTFLALQLLFHRELHADGMTSPLVEDPDTFLRAWHGSDIARLLRAPSTDDGRLDSRTRVTSRDRPHVLVLPGSYPKFAGPVVEALSGVATVTVQDLSARAEFRGLGPRLEVVEARVLQALGQEFVPDYELLENLEGADSVFVDWADRGALMATLLAPQGVPLILRIHSMDALSPWIHLIDWDRVTDLVFVSEHLRTIVLRLLGDRLRDTRVTVIPLLLDTERIATHKMEGAHRRLIMVGWSQRVKDPIWALDVLGRLRAHDDEWRMTMLGSDLNAGAVRSADDYADAVRERVSREDVCGAVDFIGFTRDIKPVLATAGFAVSSSRRESFGAGLVEAAGSGTVPVVRNWPMFATVDAARTLYPPEWVVNTVDEAVERILALSDKKVWQSESDAVPDVTTEHFSIGDSSKTFRDLILGET